MARTIKEIQTQIITSLQSGDDALTLSTSKVAEWRLWTYVVALAIHTFEVILDLFRREMNELTERITPGTERWYAQMCRRFQNGHELLFDPQTAMLHYAADDPEARIIKVVAVTTGGKQVTLKVAKVNEQGKIVPLVGDALYNFIGYAQEIKFADHLIVPISTEADLIRYNLEVYYSPAVPITTVRADIEKALANFRLSLNFDAKFYAQRLIEAVMSVRGVVTADLKAIERKRASDAHFDPFNVMIELQSGYFEYAEDCTLQLTSIKAEE